MGIKNFEEKTCFTAPDFKQKTMRSWVVILWLILFYPVGVVLMWIKTNWNKILKISLTIMFSLIFLVSCISGISGNIDQNDTIANSTVSPTFLNEYKLTEAPLNTETSIEKSTVEKTELPTEIQTKSSTEKQTEAPTENQTDSTPTYQPSYTPAEIIVLNYTNTVKSGEKASISIQGQANTKYYISVTYSSGESEAKGLETKISDESGNVSWTWSVGAKTKPGTYPIKIYGNGTSISVDFTVY